jgi:hypothetical protein
MLAQVDTSGVKEKNSAVECATVALDDANDEVDLVLDSDVAEGCGSRAGNIDGTVPITTVFLASCGRTRSNNCTKAQAAWVGGDKRLRKDHKPGSLIGGFSGQDSHFLESAFSLKSNWGRLNNGST